MFPPYGWKRQLFGCVVPRFPKVCRWVTSGTISRSKFLKHKHHFLGTNFISLDSWIGLNEESTNLCFFFFFWCRLYVDICETNIFDSQICLKSTQILHPLISTDRSQWVAFKSEKKNIWVCIHHRAWQCGFLRALPHPGRIPPLLHIDLRILLKSQLS